MHARELGLPQRQLRPDLRPAAADRATASTRRSTPSLRLRPDRIAFYAYAHVPWIKPEPAPLHRGGSARTATRAARCTSSAASGSTRRGYRRDRHGSLRAAAATIWRREHGRAGCTAISWAIRPRRRAAARPRRVEPSATPATPSRRTKRTCSSTRSACRTRRAADPARPQCSMPRTGPAPARAAAADALRHRLARACRSDAVSGRGAGAAAQAPPPTDSWCSPIARCR